MDSSWKEKRTYMVANRFDYVDILYSDIYKVIEWSGKIVSSKKTKKMKKRQF